MRKLIIGIAVVSMMVGMIFGQTAGEKTIARALKSFETKKESYQKKMDKDVGKAKKKMMKTFEGALKKLASRGQMEEFATWNEVFMELKGGEGVNISDIGVGKSGKKKSWFK